MLLTHDELFKQGEINFGEPRRMTWEEMLYEFPCHFLVLKDIIFKKNHEIESAVVVKVSFCDKSVCTDYAIDNRDCRWYPTSDRMWRKDPEYVANVLYKNYGSDRHD